MKSLAERERLIEISIFVLSVTALLWALVKLFGVDTLAPWDYAMVPLLASVAFASASQLMREQRMRWAMVVVSAVLVVVGLAVVAF